MFDMTLKVLTVYSRNNPLENYLAAAWYFTCAINPWLNIRTVVHVGLQSEGKDDVLQVQTDALEGPEGEGIKEGNKGKDILGSLCAYMRFFSVSLTNISGLVMKSTSNIILTPTMRSLPMFPSFPASSMQKMMLRVDSTYLTAYVPFFFWNPYSYLCHRWTTLQKLLVKETQARFVNTSSVTSPTAQTLMLSTHRCRLHARKSAEVLPTHWPPNS